MFIFIVLLGLLFVFGLGAPERVLATEPPVCRGEGCACLDVCQRPPCAMCPAAASLRKEDREAQRRKALAAREAEST
jgi:hypothetical protein